jgi:hypothetical protein
VTPRSHSWAWDPEEISDRIVTKRLESSEAAGFVRLRLDNRQRRHGDPMPRRPTSGWTLS